MATDSLAFRAGIEADWKYKVLDLKKHGRDRQDILDWNRLKSSISIKRTIQ